MKAPKNITNIAETKTAAKSISPKLVDKLKASTNFNFSIEKNIEVEETEIRITVKGNNLIGKLYVKGTPVMQQVVLVKPIPSPPPIKPKDFKKIVEGLRFKIAIEK